VNVEWFGSQMQVTSINGLDNQLRQVASELKAKPDLAKYLENPGGSFTWRPIAGTKLQSAHSFGIAVDIKTKFADYWRWKDATKVAPYVNRIPCEIAEIFERHGFIWVRNGGTLTQCILSADQNCCERRNLLINAHSNHARSWTCDSAAGERSR
jgi:hypothetical protein